jgi:endonuclease/exonuclease/phosphatase (EEP) superfamily protein YafD
MEAKRHTPESALFSLRLVAWSALVAAALLSHVPTKAEEAEPPADFTLAIYNVNYGNADLRGVVRTIRESKADVVALQETNKRSETYLRRALRKSYPHMVFHHAPGAGGFALLSKVPLEKPGYSPPSPDTGGRIGTQTARVMLGDRELLLVNVHLTATVPRNGMNAKDMLDLFTRTEDIRGREIRHIVGQLPKRWPVVMLGDFNSIPALSGVPGFMTRSGFTDCFASAVENADELPTWHWKTANRELLFRLDYLFSARTNAKTVSGEVVRGDASDHFLVACSYRWLPVPVTLGEVRAQAVSVVYLVDTTDMTLERTGMARELVAGSIARLKPEQYLCAGIAGGKERLVPAELAPATEENRAAAGGALPTAPAAPGLLLPALRKAMDILEDEAAPKILFIVSDRLGKDAELLKAVRSAHTDKRLQLHMVDARGKPLP